MSLAFGGAQVNGLNAVQTKAVGDWKSIDTVDANRATTYQISQAINEIIRELGDKSSVNVQLLDQLDPEKADTYDIARSLNKILLFLKAQDL